MTTPHQPEFIPFPTTEKEHDCPETTCTNMNHVPCASGVTIINSNPFIPRCTKSSQCKDIKAMLNKLSEHVFFMQSGGFYSWSESMNYQVGSIIKGEDGRLYQAIKPSGADFGGAQPTSNTEYWVDYVKQNSDSDSWKDYVDQVTASLASSIRKPLTTNTTFYVRTDGNDANNGSANTKDKAFKTINYALNYVADNYNLGNHNVTIRVSAGIYEEAVVLPKYISTSGRISIVGENKQTTRLSVKDNHNITSIASAGLFSIQGLGLDVINTNTEKNLYLSWVTASSGVTINISDVDCTYVAMPDTVSAFYGLSTALGGFLHIYNGVSATITRQNDKGSQSFLTTVGKITRNGSPQDDTMYLSGECTQIIYAQSGEFSRNSSYGEALFSGNVIGRKYLVKNGGRINTNGAGAEYFPGSVAGTVDSSTYSWYK